MSDITIRTVKTKKELAEFINFHYELYKDSEYDVPNLFMDEMATLSKDKNAAFEFCEAEYYLAERDGRVVGRVAAIINNKANKTWGKKDVRFGWIDFIDDKSVLEALMGAVEDFGKKHGMDSVVGPLGFIDMDPEGMLVKGFDQLSTMPTIYNYEYYPRLFSELSGFEKDCTYVEYKIRIPEQLPDRLVKLTSMVQKRYNLQVRKVKRSEIFGKEHIAQKIFHIINDTYSHLYGYSTLSEKQIDQLVGSYMPMLDLNLVVLIEDHNTPDHKLVGVGIALPSLSHALKKCRRGRLLPFGWWHVLRALKMHKTDIVDLLLIGVLPEYRAKGASALIFVEMVKYFKKYNFKWAETQTELETNTAVQGQWDEYDKVQHKRRICVRKKI